MKDSKVPFLKSSLDIRAQITLLQQRGLTIINQEFAAKCLMAVSYYRLSAYFDSFYQDNNCFKAGSTFDGVWQLYVFDRRLRLCFIDALERIEVALRTSVSNTMANRYGTLWYRDDTLFNKQWKIIPRNRKASPFQQFTKEVENLCQYRTADAIKHYYETYSEPLYPPSWMLIENISFGVCETLFQHIHAVQDRRAICAVFGYHPTVIGSTLRALRYTRNVCAHHGRLWNRCFVFRPKHVHAFGNLACEARSLYEQAFVIGKLQAAIAPQSHWKQRLYALFQEFPDVPFHKMGFQQDWKNDPFWEMV